jgi:hypothetical protein
MDELSFDDRDEYAAWVTAAEKLDHLGALSAESGRLWRRREWRRCQAIYREIVDCSAEELAAAFFAEDPSGQEEWLLEMRRWFAWHQRTLGSLCLHLKEYDEARAAFEAVCREVPDDPHGWMGMAALALRTRRWRDAWAYYRKGYDAGAAARRP